MPVGNGVGRGIRSIRPTSKPCRSRRRRYSSGVGKYQGISAAPSMPRRAKAACKRHDDRSDVAVAAELADEPAAGAQRARDAGDHGVGIGAHPVQGGVREYGVELAGERQGRAIGEPWRPRRGPSLREPCRARRPRRRPHSRARPAAGRAPRRRSRGRGCARRVAASATPVREHPARRRTAHGSRSAPHPSPDLLAELAPVQLP